MMNMTDLEKLIEQIKRGEFKSDEKESKPKPMEEATAMDLAYRFAKLLEPVAFNEGDVVVQKEGCRTYQMPVTDLAIVTCLDKSRINPKLFEHGLMFIPQTMIVATLDVDGDLIEIAVDARRWTKWIPKKPLTDLDS